LTQINTTKYLCHKEAQGDCGFWIVDFNYKKIKKIRGFWGKFEKWGGW
jgi:hypothetical protein